MATYFMNLTLPEVSVAATTTWATQLNTAVTSIDSHNHTVGEGQRLTSASLNIDTDIAFGSYSIDTVQGINITPLASGLGVDNSMYVKSGDLYFVDNASNDIGLTSGGGINLTGVGSIYGDYSDTDATVYYTDDYLRYTLEDSNSDPADIEVAAIANTTLDLTNTSTVAALIASSTTALTGANITGAGTFSGDIALTGNCTGRGIIPVGAVIGLAEDLTGVSVPVGFSALDGSTIDDSDSPMDGVTLPNINDSVFLMGASTAGTVGGAASYTLSEAQLPAHVHTINNSHADTFALSNATSASSTHTHNIAHTHMWADVDHPGGSQGSIPFELYSLDNSSTTSTSISSSDSEALYRLGDGSNPTAGGGSTFTSTFILTFNDKLYTSGVVDAPSGSGSSAVSATPSATTVVGLAGAVSSNTGDESGSVGSGSSITNLPSYISTQYIIRIK